MKKCGMNSSTLGSDSQDCSAWRSLCSEAVTQFQDKKVAVLQHKHAVHKQEAQPLSNLGTWPCDHFRGSALPESDCTLTNSLNDDKDNRSIDFDGAVHVCVMTVEDACSKRNQCRFETRYVDEKRHKFWGTCFPR